MAKNIINQYFSYYKTHGLKTRLSDYKINEIFLSDEDITVKYDVKPFFGKAFDYWYVGNGVESEDGWCRGKTDYYKIITKEDNKYTLEHIGTMD